MRAIIPCCGFGTRMNMPPNQSKEMLLDRLARPLIRYSIVLCRKHNISPLVLVRKEKTDLIEWLKEGKIEYVIMKPGKEWAETVLNSKKHWDEKNILMLPDTRFEPEDALKQVKRSLEFGSEAVFAVHEVDDISKWGFVNIDGYCEKPDSNKPGTAWGLIGFTKASGEILFSEMQIKGQVFLHEPGTNFIFLDKFEDLTRNNIITK